MLTRIATYFIWRAIRPFVWIGGVGLAIGSGLNAQDTPSPKPVFVGGEAQFDACASFGQVSVKPTPGNFLALRARPSRDGALIVKLPNSQDLIICAQNEDWLGVLIAEQGTDCGVSSPIPVRQPYKGPCKVGWVHEAFVTFLAG